MAQYVAGKSGDPAAFGGGWTVASVITALLE
jgi:hypothetical protein